jgi:cytidine deaminase
LPAAFDRVTMDDIALLERAREAIERSHAPYSGYQVGAALETTDGEIVPGSNVENANYSNSIHAEELALSIAVTEGHRGFERIAVSSGPRDGVTPCGACRQSLAEFCDDGLRIICEGDDAPTTYTLGELLPNTITSEHLE